MYTPIWSKEAPLPCDPGWYWFYGKLVGEETDRMHIVTVSAVKAFLDPVFSCEGKLFYTTQNIDGWWQPVIVPFPPNGSY